MYSRRKENLSGVNTPVHLEIGVSKAWLRRLRYAKEKISRSSKSVSNKHTLHVRQGHKEVS